jgi:tRNA modification GTPase
MGLSKAEALGSLLDASNYNQVLLSRGGMEGRVGKKCAELYEKLRSVAANIYAKIDFPDEDLSSLSRDEFCEELRAVGRDIDGFASTYTTGRAVSEGVRTVICGSTNVGKSSLYNLFVGRDAAIVTDIEGTTRDTLEETVSVGRATLRLCDTAGLRDASDTVEKIGIERTKNALSKAELIIAVFDGTRGFSPDDNDFVKALNEFSAEKIAVINKADGEQKFDVSEFSSTFNNIIYMSALTGEGFEKLCCAIESAFIDERINLSTDAIIANSRQYATLVRAREHIAAALESFEAGYSEDVCCVDIEMAMADLGELDGKQVGDDIVAEIFSHFCVGK